MHLDGWDGDRFRREQSDTMLSFLLPALALLRPPAAISTTTSRRGVLLGAGAAATLALPISPAFAADEIYTPKAGSLVGKTILITGANTGLGLESAKRLAAGGATIVVSARSKEKADSAATSGLNQYSSPRAGDATTSGLR